jgi:hypothetical protein
MVLACTVLHAQDNPDEWITIAVGTQCVIQYRPRDVKVRDNKIVRVWTRWIYSEDAVKEEGRRLAQEFGAYGAKERRWENFRFTLILVELDCNQHLTRSGNATFYDASGSVLGSVNNKRFGEWSEPNPDSMAETLLREFCKLYIQKKSK